MIGVEKQKTKRSISKKNGLNMTIFAGLLAVLATVASLVTEMPTKTSSIEIVQSISLPKEIDGVKMRELSALAFDPVEGVMWAISDKAELHRFNVEYKQSVPVGVRYIGSTKLETALSNAEGMDYVPASGANKKGRLFVAFEDGPALISFSPDGTLPLPLQLPSPLADPKAYAEENSRLESVTLDRKGRFFTAPEEALSDRDDTNHTIFSGDGSTFTFPTFQPHRSNIKALEYLKDKDKMLVLERTRDEGGASTMRLRLVDTGSCQRSMICSVQELHPAEPSSFEGNFEGLTRLRGNYFAAVTDTKSKDATVTRLVFFKLDVL